MENIFTRSKLNPILKSNPQVEWESFKVYNPGAIYEDGKYHLFYRAVGRGEDWHSSIGHAVSDDGERFERLAEPALVRENDSEKRGLEDPRITKIDDTFYMAYAAYDGVSPRLSIATSKDLMIWKKYGPALKNFKFENVGGEFLKWQNGKFVRKTKVGEWSKSGGIFPRKIDGKYWMMFGEYKIWMATSDDLISWSVISAPMVECRPENFFDCAFVEMGPPPIETEKGWLVLYHGIDFKANYRIGFVLLDLEDPQKILFRCDEPIFEAQEPYELSGLIDILPGGVDALQKMNEKDLLMHIQKMKNKNKMPTVVFCPGAVLKDGVLRIFYGAGDDLICTATAEIGDILNLIC
jgi:beta-1,2-mannobiose phosphorylase / 1,2-beta-oligomannan phosphorylase